jgi:hypothetical protein
MADYVTSRDSAFVFRIRRALEEFASEYGLNPSIKNRRTIFLFPGGLGSQLMRADLPYPQVPQGYEKVWLDGGVFEDAPHLEVLPGGVDTEQRFVIPDGCVDIPGPIRDLHPYTNFSQWCRDHAIDLFVFAWDWRRSVQDAADFFLKVFLPIFDVRFGGHTPHPLDYFSLIGHSAGGMVVKAILNSTADQYVQRVKKAITVATPFYGYGMQIHRYLQGDPLLSPTPIPRSTTVRIISSMPGGYEYLYLDHETYEANKVAFANDPEGYNLAAYPSMDKDDPTAVADPYDAQPDDNGRVRYPFHYGFDSSLLYRAKIQTRKLSSAFTDPAIAAKFYNIRGVQSRDGVVLNDTVVGQSWGRISPEFDPDTDPDSIDDKMGPGDSIEPAWTTRLLGLPDPASQVITIVGDDIHHATMMDVPKVQMKIAELIGLDPTVMRFRSENTERLAASRSEFNAFLDGMHQLMADRELPPERRKGVTSAYLRGFTPIQLQRFLARYYLDALKSPSQTSRPSRSSEPAPPQPAPAPRSER